MSRQFWPVTEADDFSRIVRCIREADFRERPCADAARQVADFEVNRHGWCVCEAARRDPSLAAILSSYFRVFRASPRDSYTKELFIRIVGVANDSAAAVLRIGQI